MSRVTPLQSALVSLPSGSQYVPLRPIGDAAAIAQADKLAAQTSSATAAAGPSGGKGSSAASTTSRGLGAGSSIVLLRTAPGTDAGKEAEYIELDRNLWPHPAPQQAQTTEAAPADPSAGAGSAAGSAGPREPGPPMSTQLRPNPNAPEASAPEPFEYPFND